MSKVRFLTWAALVMRFYSSNSRQQAVFDPDLFGGHLEGVIGRDLGTPAASSSSVTTMSGSRIVEDASAVPFSDQELLPIYVNKGRILKPDYILAPPLGFPDPGF